MEKWHSRIMESLSSSNTCQCAHFLYYTHTAEERSNLWSSHLCGSPSTPGFHTFIQLCRFMTIWNQTISYTLLEYLQELCLGRLNRNRRCHLFSTVMISYVGQVELIACQRMKNAPPTCGFRQATQKIAEWILRVPKVTFSATYKIQAIQLQACGARGKGVVQL